MNFKPNNLIEKLDMAKFTAKNWQICLYWDQTGFYIVWTTLKNKFEFVQSSTKQVTILLTKMNMSEYNTPNEKYWRQLI